MSNVTFRAVAALIADLTAKADRREALFVNGPVVIAVVADLDPDLVSQYHVVTNFVPPDTPGYRAVFMTEWAFNLGYVPASFSDLNSAHNFAWTLYLNMTHTHDDLVVRRKVRKAKAAAVQAGRLLTDLEDDFFDHAVHPTTLDNEQWEMHMYNRLWANYDGRFADANGKSKLSKEADDYVMACIYALADAKADNFDDNDVLLPAASEFDDVYVDPRAYGEDRYPENLSGNLPNIGSEFPDWDDPEHGLEVRMSRQYEVHHGIAA